MSGHTDGLCAQIDTVVAGRDFGEATAAKRGRRPEWPYVPIIHHPNQTMSAIKGRTEQIRRRAYATRQEAIDCATRVIEARKQHMKERLLDPRHRAEREKYGLPRDIASAKGDAS